MSESKNAMSPLYMRVPLVCPNCSTEMSLLSVVPDMRGFKPRTFECPECEHTEGWVFKRL